MVRSKLRGPTISAHADVLPHSTPQGFTTKAHQPGCISKIQPAAHMYGTITLPGMTGMKGVRYWSCGTNYSNMFSRSICNDSQRKSRRNSSRSSLWLLRASTVRGQRPHTYPKAGSPIEAMLALYVSASEPMVRPRKEPVEEAALETAKQNHLRSACLPCR